MRQFYRWSLSGVAVIALALAIAPSASMAYPTYSMADGTGNCLGCHGDFRDDPYTSMTSKDGVSWGTDLMDGHQVEFGIDGGSNCDVCHAGSDRSVVFIASSDGAGGLAPLGCLGCHGRDEGAGVDGAGLRRKHAFAGCTSVCHMNDPATPVAEIVPPPYYANPGSGHTIPSHPCDLAAQPNPEGVFGSWGLDNDGNGAYDSDEDLSCAPLVPVENLTWGRIKALYE